MPAFAAKNCARLLSTILSCSALTLPGFASGLYREGASARSMGLGGSSTATADNPLDALFDNPAALSEIRGPTLAVNATAGFVSGRFRNRANDDAHLGEEGVMGSAAFSVPAGPVRFGFGVNPEIALRGRWRYRDTPGGADGRTSYGERAHESETTLLRTSAGVSWQITPQLSAGASAGLLYSENRLKAPYIFQKQPVLRTVKTLLDLETEGYGWNAQSGLLWKPVAALQLGVTYTSRTRIVTDGRASGNAGVQLANLGLGAAQPDFSYDAEVTNVFPQQVSAGLAWQATSRLMMTAQVDWVNWADAFDTLEVRLTNGSNDDLNGLVGSGQLNDNVPLNWRDQWVAHFGVEYALGERWAMRAGYSYGRSPVPDETLTPLTAAITEHIVSAGAGYQRGRTSIDLAWQWELPATARVSESILAAGEYSDSRIEVGIHWLGLTTTVEF